RETRNMGRIHRPQTGMGGTHHARSPDRRSCISVLSAVSRLIQIRRVPNAYHISASEELFRAASIRWFHHHQSLDHTLTVLSARSRKSVPNTGKRVIGGFLGLGE